jgi:hypothetical protein
MNHLTSYILSPAGRIHNFAFFLFTFQTDRPISLGQLCKTKPICQVLKMNVTTACIRDYENKHNWTLSENKPNLSRRSLWRSRIKPESLNFSISKNSLTTQFNSLEYLFLCGEREFVYEELYGKKTRVRE